MKRETVTDCERDEAQAPSPAKPHWLRSHLSRRENLSLREKAMCESLSFIGSRVTTGDAGAEGTAARDFCGVLTY